MNSEEIVTIVDDRNNVVGAEPRWRMRSYGLPHRAAYILVFNSAGELFVQKRTDSKDIYPGHYDVAAGGVVMAGESYESAALRELEEELGIRGTPLEQQFDFYYEEAGNRVWGRVYSCVYDGEMVLQKEEVERGDFQPIDEILRQCERRPYTPDGLYVIQRYLSQRASRGASSR